MQINKNDTQLTDIQLINAIGKGDTTAMALLYERYWKVLYLSAWNILQDKYVAEDLVHDVFCSIWTRREELNKIEIPIAYLRRSIRFGVYNYIRNNKVRKEVFSNLSERLIGIDLSSEEIFERKEVTNQIENAINSLPTQCREVFILSRQNDLSHRQIADRLNISPKTVERHITLAFKKLRDYISKTSFLLF